MNHAPETRNPFTNGQIVGTSVLPSVYHKQDHKRGELAYVMSRSSLMDFAACPAKWLLGWSRKDTDATRFGSLLDCLLLTLGSFNDLYCVEPATYPAPDSCVAVKRGEVKEGDPIPWNNTAKHCQIWTAQNRRGREVVSRDEYEEATTAAARLEKDHRADEVFACSDTQVWIEADYTDKETGVTVRVKTLIDLLPREGTKYQNAIADFKTARDASPRPFTKQIHEHHYDAQAALSQWLYEAATGNQRPDFLHVIQENTPPWMTARRMLSVEFIALGQLKIKEALALYCRCLSEQRWPDWDDDSPYDGWTLVEPEAWMLGK